MSEISTFTRNGIEFNVKPPVEVGERTVASLGALAAIAALGYEADDPKLQILADESDRVLSQLDTLNNPTSRLTDYLTNVGSRSRKNHIFFV